MITRRDVFIMPVCALVAGPALAQFTGPSEQDTGSSVQDALDARIGAYMTLEGYITHHLREDYYRFTDGVNEIRVEIPGSVFAGRPIGPNDRVRLRVEVDRGLIGRYLWVEALEVL
jgi:uncharacterized protein (TIGR00156 family)